MTFSTSRTKAVVMAGAVAFAISGIVTPANAAPFATIGASSVAAAPMVEQVQVKRKRVPVAKVRKRKNNAAAAAAIVGIGVLGLAAAAAAQSQPRRGRYYTDQWGNPVDAYGRPVYVDRPVQYYYEQPGYYQQPGYYEQPGYYRRPQVNEWERQEIRARERAQREAQREQARRQQLIYQQQQQYRQPVYRGGPVYADPRSDGRRGGVVRQPDADATGGNRGN